MTSCTQGAEEDRTHLSDEQVLNEKVLYRIDGRKFVIPLAYHYWAKVRRGSWPRPKSEYRDVTTTKMIDAVLPDMLPYTQSTKHYFEERQGHGKLITIIIEKGSPPFNPVSYVLELRNLKEPEHVSDVPGLVQYVDDSRAAGKRDVYTLAELKEGEVFHISCTRPNDKPYPGCRAVDSIPEAPGPLKVTYSFSRTYIQQWETIRKNIWALIAGFEIVQQASGPD